MSIVTRRSEACAVLLVAGVLLTSARPSAAFDCKVRVGLDGKETLTSLQIELSYAQDFLEIEGSGAAADCSNLSPFAAEFVDDDRGGLSAKFSSLDPHTGPMELMECVAHASARPRRTYVAVNVTEAHGGDGALLESHPSVSVRDLDCPGIPEGTPSTTTTTVGDHRLRETAVQPEPIVRDDSSDPTGPGASAAESPPHDTSAARRGLLIEVPTSAEPTAGPTATHPLQ
jgi:hypothetical protein